MTDFIITSPDGQKFKISGPEGSTADQAVDIARGQGLFNAMQPPRTASGVRDFFKSIPRGMVGGLSSAASSLGQAASLEMGQPEQAAEIPGAEQTTEIAEKALNLPGMHKPETTAGKYGASVGEALGNPASWVGPGGLVAKTASNVASGLGAQLGEEATGSGWGRFAGGVIGAAAPRTIARTVRPAGEVPELRQQPVAVLREHGVEPMAGDVFGSRRIHHAEETGDYLGGGGSYTRNKERVGRELTAAVNRYMGEEADRATPEVLQQARDRMGPMFENAANQLPIRLDRRFADDLVAVAQEMRTWGLPEAEINRISAQFDNIITAFQTTRGGQNVMTGRGYQSLTRAGTALDHALKDENPNVRHFAERTRAVLDDAVERNVETAVRNAFSRGSPTGPARARAIDMAESLEQLREARRQWFSMIVISKSVDENGIISPARLKQNLTNSPENKLNYALERTDLHRLARAAKEIIKPEKSSGTAERAMANVIPAGLAHAAVGAMAGGGAGHAAGGPVVGLPATIAGAAAPGITGRMINSVAGQTWLKNQRQIPYLGTEQTPSLPWSMLRGGVDMLGSQGGGDALAP